MHERDLEAEQPGAWPFVDEIGAGTGQLCDRRLEICHLVRDVMHARTAPGEEASHRRVVAEGLEQLEPALADPQGCCADPLIRDGCPVLDHGTEEPFVRVESCVEILNRDSQMVDPARRHSIDSIRSGSVPRE